MKTLRHSVLRVATFLDVIATQYYSPQKYSSPRVLLLLWYSHGWHLIRTFLIIFLARWDFFYCKKIDLKYWSCQLSYGHHFWIFSFWSPQKIWIEITVSKILNKRIWKSLYSGLSEFKTFIFAKIVLLFLTTKIGFRILKNQQTPFLIVSSPHIFNNREDFFTI